MSLTLCDLSNAGMTERRCVGRLADATLIDGAVLSPDVSTGLYTFSSILGTAHAGTPAQTQIEADSRMSDGWYDLLFFRSTTGRTVWNSASTYDAAQFEPFRLYRVSGKGRGWTGHTWQAADAGAYIYPKDDGTPENLITAGSFTLPYGLYFCILVVARAYVFGQLRSNNSLDRYIFPTGPVTDGVLAEFNTSFSEGTPGSYEREFQTPDDASFYGQSTLPLQQSGFQNIIGLSTNPLLPGPTAAVCCQDSQVVRFRVNRAQWSS